MELKTLNLIELALALVCLTIILVFPGIGVLFAFLALLIYTALGKSKEKIASYGFKKPLSWPGLLITTALFGLLLAISFESIIEPVIEKLLQTKLDLSDLEGIKGNTQNYLLMLLVGWLVGGFLEEILFRGFLVTRISDLFKNRKLGNTIAILVTSGVFGLAHMYQDWPGVIATGLISIILGIVFVSSGRNLWYSIFIHGFNNTFAITVIYLDLENNINQWFIS